METGVKVGDVMSKGIVTIRPDETVRKVCEIMAKHDLSGLTVMEGGKVVGMVTQGDLVQMIANSQNPSSVQVKEIMGTKKVSISPDVDISEAAKVMVKNKVKRLPVLREGKLIGVITQTDIIRISPSVYDLIFEKAKAGVGAMLEEEVGMSGECEECGNYSEQMRNVNGTLVCEECYEEIENQV